MSKSIQVGLLMGVDDSSQVDLPAIDRLFQDRTHSIVWGLALATVRGTNDLLRRVCRVNYHGIFGFVIDNQVGVVVATPNPCKQSIRSQTKTMRLLADFTWEGGDKESAASTYT